jgi:hypothetical protein
VTLMQFYVDFTHYDNSIATDERYKGFTLLA